MWGNYTCYVVDLSSREMRIEEELATQDRITNVRVQVDAIYHALDGELVALGVEDALQSLREDIVTLLRREIVRLPLEQVTEQLLEANLNQQSAYFQTRLGIAIERTRVQVDWPKEVLESRREARKRIRAQKEEEENRRWEWQMADQARDRKESLELKDIEHINELIRQLGMVRLPADVRLRLVALPREQAYQEIIKLIEVEREKARQAWGRRMQEEYALLRDLIDKGILEDLDLVEFGKHLLDRYQHSLMIEQSFGGPPEVLFGGVPRDEIGGPGGKGLPGGEDQSDKDSTELESEEPAEEAQD